MNQEENKRGFVWYALRIFFWIMIILAIISFIILFTSHTIIGTFTLIILILMSLTFILSIIHFFIYKKKIFPIIVILIDLILFGANYVIVNSVR